MPMSVPLLLLRVWLVTLQAVQYPVVLGLRFPPVLRAQRNGAVGTHHTPHPPVTAGRLKDAAINELHHGLSLLRRWLLHHPSSPSPAVAGGRSVQSWAGWGSRSRSSRRRCPALPSAVVTVGRQRSPTPTAYRALALARCHACRSAAVHALTGSRIPSRSLA